MSQLERLLKRVPDSVQNAIGLISGIITIITAITTVIGIVIALTKGSFSISAINKPYVAVVVVCAMNVFLLNKTIKYRKIQAQTREVFSKSYYTLLHDYRNLKGELEVSEYNKYAVYHQIVNFLTNTLDSLCSIFNILTRQEVSACIKIIEPSNNLEYLTAKVKTFCRSKNSDSRRFQYDNDSTRNETIICKNTDFNSIVQPGKTVSCFYKRDLEAYQKQHQDTDDEYLNSNPEWKKYYKATIVVPIRIANKRNANVESQDSYTILGFLCIDSLSTHAFEESQEKYYTRIVKAYAALLYSVLDVYKNKIGFVSCNAIHNGQRFDGENAAVFDINAGSALKKSVFGNDNAMGLTKEEAK